MHSKAMGGATVLSNPNFPKPSGMLLTQQRPQRLGYGLIRPRDRNSRLARRPTHTDRVGNQTHQCSESAARPLGPALPHTGSTRTSRAGTQTSTHSGHSRALSVVADAALVHHDQDAHAAVHSDKAAWLAPAPRATGEESDTSKA